MKENITVELVNNFSKKYNNSQNKNIEKEISAIGLKEFLYNKDILSYDKREFNIELDNIKRENQQESSRCWIFAGINFLKYDISNKLNCDINIIDLSYNYISFFDKLEKFNSIYNKILYEKNINLDNIFKVGLTEWGHWIYFVKIIEKYGLVPKNIMPENKNSNDSEQLMYILNQKLKKDIYELIEIKNNDFNNIDFDVLKEQKLFEVYEILSKILGEPKNKFDYSYYNKNGERVALKDINPIEFKNKILSLNLNDYIAISSFEMENKEYYKKYINKNLQDIYNETFPEYINLPIDELKKLAVNQLKDGIPVRFSSEIKFCIDNDLGIMDADLYNYDKILTKGCLTKKQLLDAKVSMASHGMIFSGVHIENGNPIRWKVEDTRSISRNYDGPYVMNDNFFDMYVYVIYIHKKYLNNEQLKVYKSRPIQVEIDDPF